VRFPALPGGGAVAAERRAELGLGALSATVLVLIVLMVAFVFDKAWPSFAHNGLAWFGSGGPGVDQQLTDLSNSSVGPRADYTIRAFPLLYATALSTAVAVIFGLVLAVLTAIFITEFAPERLRRVLEPVVRLLAAVPSVIYGLIGILVLVPFVAKAFITPHAQDSVAQVVSLDGASLGLASLILTIMITPIMVAIIVNALRAVPSSWVEGAAALGVNRWRRTWTISVRVARPAIIAAAVLATARALGEAIMLSMVSGSQPFSPNPLDGFLFFLEPARPLAATIVDNAEAVSGFTTAPFGRTIYALAAVLLVSSVLLSLGGFVAKQPLRKYGMRP